MQTTDFTPTEEGRPLRRHSIVSMVNSLDASAAMIKAADPDAVRYFDNVCREMLYRGTGLTPGDIIDGSSGMHLLNPKQAIIDELASMCIDVEVINDDRGIGWKITHAYSGIVGMLFLPSGAGGCHIGR